MSSGSSSDERASPFEETTPLATSHQKTYTAEIPLKSQNERGSMSSEFSGPAPTLSERIKEVFTRKRPLVERTIPLFHEDGIEGEFPENVIRNQKYSKWTFFPFVLARQFYSFINFFYLLLALSQLVPFLSVGFLFSYFAPLIFVISITMAKEAYDDFQRFQRDKEVNNQVYQVFTSKGMVEHPASALKVGHVVKIEQNQRIPADMVLLRTTEDDGGSFIRTDMLDGETDWKLRRAINHTQSLQKDSYILRLKSEVYAEAPKMDVYDFIGTFTYRDEDGERVVTPLTLENTLWMNTVVASGTVLGLVIYTGDDTRSTMNTASPATKKGTTDKELNYGTISLGVILVVLALIMIASNLFSGLIFIDYFRYIILFSFIVPISMSVTIDIAKLVYAVQIMNDKKIPGCVVRNTGLPEELGRISYLLSDKTGTLTRNVMKFKKLHLGTVSFSNDAMDTLQEELLSGYPEKEKSKQMLLKRSTTVKIRRGLAFRLKDSVTALALCHNVTPTEDSETGERAYQASSPDEVALVQFTEEAGITLVERDFDSITLENPFGDREVYEILNIFPFTSAKKRMGIIVRHKSTGIITFFMKGADVIMEQIVNYTDWMEEECNNLAREGLRTLAFGKKVLSEGEYSEFARRYGAAEASISDREERMFQEQQSIEKGLELLGITGVEDKLQLQVRATLEDLRNAGVKIWMLTGDKIETATCIGVSSKLVDRRHEIFQMVVNNVKDARIKLAEFSQKQYNSVLVIDGNSLQLCLDDSKEAFFKATTDAPAVICCRCSPTQKADVVSLIKFYTKKQTAAIGDGGNDVSMIQEADVGIGIEGKEGKQASMAADFSVTQFSHARRLLLWHGRNAYQRTCLMGQLVIHRGTIMTFVQLVFSLVFYSSAIALFGTMEMMGYSVWYTSLPIFMLCLDEDVREESVAIYPELYEELRKGRSFSLKTMSFWMLQSLYQGIVLIVPPLFLFSGPYTMEEFSALVFTGLINTVLINIMFEVHSWNWVLIGSELGSFAVYWWTLAFFRGSFDILYVSSFSFWWQSCMLTLIACLPVYLVMLAYRRLRTPIHHKLEDM